MTDPLYIIAHDNGTSGTKTCLTRISDKIEIVGSHLTEYGVIYPEGIPHACEQDPREWWRAICEGTKHVMKQSGIAPDQVGGITFSCQTQCSLFVDEKGVPLDNAYIWIDGRSVREYEKGIKGGLQVSGYNLAKILKWIKIAGGGPASPKDQVWKYKWFSNNKPDRFKKLHKMLDCKDYLVFKCTGNMCTSVDSAAIVWLYDTRPGRFGWSKELCATAGIAMEHLPDVKQSTDSGGGLTAAAAGEMGLAPGIPVILGGVDASCIPVGSGAIDLDDTHIYIGTSGWVITAVDKRITNIADYEASVPSAIPGVYNYVGIMESAGACLAWAKDHLADMEVEQAKQQGVPVFKLLDTMVSQTPPGANGLLFTPWLYGNRCPKEDTHVRGSFFNINLKTRRREMFRAILEGVSLHTKWMADMFKKKNVPVTEPIRYVGGGAKSDVWCQIMADVLGKRIQPVTYAQDGGAVGATLIAGVGLGATSWKEAKGLVPVEGVYEPNPANRAVYDKLYKALVQYHANNQKLFHFMNP
ncbi:MAG: FGGY-family carbohydrate kinase [Candidatus Lokiarchaeota archaeon]|nr:FGGY-family carbohydrate kinase [Candidatus Lokiarchaeota archaeon]